MPVQGAGSGRAREHIRLYAYGHLFSGVDSSFPGESALPELPLFNPLSQQGDKIASTDIATTRLPSDLLFRNIFLNIATARPWTADLSTRTPRRGSLPYSDAR